MKISKKFLKESVLNRYNLYQLNHTRLGRLLKDPLRTFCFYILNTLSRIKPYKISTKTLWGDSISFYLPEGNQIYYYGFWEANLTNFLINYLEPGHVFVDIGAHVGFYSMLASRLVEEKGFVYAFEPTPRTFLTLKENTENIKNIKVLNLAMSNKKQRKNFVDYGPKFSAFNTFVERTSDEMNFLKKKACHMKIDTVVFDDWSYKNNVIPDFIKIDAEGAEYIILKGMKSLLSKNSTLFSIEVSGKDEWKDNCRKSINIFLENNYILFEITTDGLLKEHIVKQVYEYDNLIAVPQKMCLLLKDLLIY